jgi:hypothetical protein
MAREEDVMRECLRWMVVFGAVWGMLLGLPAIAKPPKIVDPGLPDELPPDVPPPWLPETQVLVVPEPGGLPAFPILVGILRPTSDQGVPDEPPEGLPPEPVGTQAKEVGHPRDL